MQYIGEHLLPGQLGHFSILLAFVAALLSVAGYIMASRRADSASAEAANWQRIGRGAFMVHGVAVLAVIGILLYIMWQKYYEYHYVWQHVSDELPMRYILAAFWEGQEGSFLLWMFWHVLLGWVLIGTARRWEAPVVAVVALVQAFICVMLLGIYVGDYKIGSNPTLLTRDVMNIPLFKKADYLTVLKGNGLNPLLQNYWMTIHPPTLFLGFASTVVPFAFAVAALFSRKHTEWLKPVMPWALFSGFILGLGILMGGAWAYEALSFGGYWAWDPVENMSLVPWLLLVAGIHTAMIAKNTGHSLKSTYAYFLATFVMVVYSTFLTRSGVLGDTSVHAFTEMGLEAQLTLFLSAFIVLSLVAYFRNQHTIPTVAKEEPTASREFWMFIGTLVLLFSAVLITFTTSIPVYKKVASLMGITLNITSPIEPVAHYNKYQLWIGVFIGLLSGVAQFLRYKEFNLLARLQKLGTRLAIHLAIAVAATVALTYWINANAWQYRLLLAMGIFAITTNLDYFVSVAQRSTKMVGSMSSHIGFGIMLIGILASGLNKDYISTNRFAQRGLVEGFTDENYKRNILLLKGVPMFMSGYEVTYVSDTLEHYNRTFTVNYKKKGKNGAVEQEFNLTPNVIYTKDFSKIAASNPSTKRYADKDIFTHIASLPRAEIDPEFAKQQEDSLKYEAYNALIGDTIFTKKYYAIVKGIDKKPTHKDYKPDKMDLAIGLDLEFRDIATDSAWRAMPVIVLRGNVVLDFPVHISNLALKARLNEGVFDALFTPENKLPYQKYTLKEGQRFKVGATELALVGFNKKPEHPYYVAEKDDIAVGAILAALKGNDTLYAQPVFLIRNNQPFNLKDEIAALGIHARFVEIDPKTETVTLQVAQTAKKQAALPFEIAENAPRTDYIVLEAIVFPGINLFWAGSLLMLLGMLIAMYHRRKTNAAA